MATINLLTLVCESINFIARLYSFAILKMDTIDFGLSTQAKMVANDILKCEHVKATLLSFKNLKCFIPLIDYLSENCVTD